MLRVMPILLITLFCNFGFSQFKCGPGMAVDYMARPVHWKTLPVVWHIDESVPKEFEDAFKFAVEEWNNSFGKELLKVEDKRVKNPPSTLNVLYFLKEWPKDRSQGEFAYASLNWAGNEMRKVTIRINGKYKYFSIMENPVGANRESLMVHELGHGLGLLHNDKTSSVMSTYMKQGTIRYKPSESDLNALACAY